MYWLVLALVKDSRFKSFDFSTGGCSTNDGGLGRRRKCVRTCIDVSVVYDSQFKLRASLTWSVVLK